MFERTKRKIRRQRSAVTPSWSSRTGVMTPIETSTKKSKEFHFAKAREFYKQWTESEAELEKLRGGS